MATPPARAEISDTYPNPSNAVARVGFGKLYDFAIGLLGTTGNAAEARTALGIGQAISFRNRARNGSFSVNQRAVSGTVTLAAGVYGHDGWKAGAGGCTYTFATSGGKTTLTITAGTLVQVIEDRDIEGGIYCMSWTGTAQGKFSGGSFGATGINSSSIVGGTAVTFEFNTGTLTDVQVEPGTVPTPTERRPYGDELERCRRYYQTSYEGQPAGTASASTGRIAVYSSSSSAYVMFPITFAPRMRTSPTLTIYNPTTGAVGSARNESSGADFAIGIVAASGTGPGFASITTVAAPPASQIMSIHYTASADL